MRLVISDEAAKMAGVIIGKFAVQGVVIRHAEALEIAVAVLSQSLDVLLAVYVENYPLKDDVSELSDQMAGINKAMLERVIEWVSK